MRLFLPMICFRLSFQTTTPSLGKASSSNNNSNNKLQQRRRRTPERHHSGNLSDATVSTVASSNDESSVVTVTTTPHKPSSPLAKTKKTSRRRRGRANKKSKCSTKNNNNNNSQQQVTLSDEEKARYLAMDCEMVGVGPCGRYSALARVSIVNWDGEVLLDEYVQPGQPVTDYRTAVSGITAQHVDDAPHTLTTIRPVVAALLADKILVGHSLKCDLQALHLSHPWYDTRDTAKYEPFLQTRADGNPWPRKLRELCVARNLVDAATFQMAAHCSVADATAAMRLYQTVRTKWEKVMEYKKNKTMEILTAQAQQQQQQLQRQAQHDDEERDTSTDEDYEESSQALSDVSSHASY